MVAAGVFYWRCRATTAGRPVPCLLRLPHQQRPPGRTEVHVLLAADGHLVDLELHRKREDVGRLDETEFGRESVALPTTGRRGGLGGVGGERELPRVPFPAAARDASLHTVELGDDRVPVVLGLD